MNLHKKTEIDLQIQKTFQQIQWRERKENQTRGMGSRYTNYYV